MFRHISLANPAVIGNPFEMYLKYSGNPGMRLWGGEEVITRGMPSTLLKRFHAWTGARSWEGPQEEKLLLLRSSALGGETRSARVCKRFDAYYADTSRQANIASQTGMPNNRVILVNWAVFMVILDISWVFPGA